MTASASVVPALVVVAVGLFVGCLVGYRVSLRVHRRSAGPTAADLLERLMRSSTTAVLVLNRFGDLVLHNPRAENLGLLRWNRADPRAQTTAARVNATGEPAEVDLSPSAARTREPESIRGYVRPLGDGFVVVEAVDRSEAARLEATRRDFVANVGREITAPVGEIVLLAEAVLGSGDDPDETWRFAERILRESTRLDTLVGQLLELSHLQGARALPELVTVDVDAVVAEVLAGASAESAGVSLRTDGSSALCVPGDRALLSTALTKLVENAIDHSFPGSQVSISRRCDGEWVDIAVIDRGVGIAPAEQQRVFERFYRSDHARSRDSEGTGLGLAIVKHIAANHGGEVLLWSSPGVGSTFTLRIPAQASTRGETPALSADCRENPERSPERVS